VSRTTAIFKAITLNWLRSRSGLFFSFLFPVMFLLVFGSIFGNTNTSGHTLYVQNKDGCPGSPTCLSQNFIGAINSTKVVVVNSPILAPSVNVTAFIQSHSSFFGGNPRVLVIPSGFGANVSRGLPVNVTYISSPADQLGPIVGGVISDVANGFNFQLAGARRVVGLSHESSSARALKNVDFYVPGLTAAFMMTNGVIGLTSIASEFRRSGVTKRLSATPLRKYEWIVGNVLSQAVLALLLALVMIALAKVAYQSNVSLDGYTIAALVVGAILFSGIGMTLAGLVKDPEAASGLGNAIAFPMMFLSGTYWPVDIMPSFLQSFARVLPLTYLSDGLRDSMILGDYSAALTNMLVVSALAIVFVLLGAKVTIWKEK